MQTIEIPLFTVHTVVDVPVAVDVQVPLFLAATSTFFWCSLVDYRIMDFMGAPRNVPYSALRGSTLDTCLATVYEAFWKIFTLFLVVFGR